MGGQIAITYWALDVDIQPWCSCLSLRVGVVVHGFRLQCLEQGGAARCVSLDDKQSCIHLVEC